MWGFQREPFLGGGCLRFAIQPGGRSACFAYILSAWQSDQPFRALYNAHLAGAPYSAFRWETPSVTTATLSRPFEFVLLDSPGLARSPESKAFATHFVGAPTA